MIGVKKWAKLVSALFLLILTACGGGGSGDGGDGATVSGVAAAGAPLTGTVKLKDSSTPLKELTKTIEPDGSFSFDVSSLTSPFILKATGTVGSTSYTLHSFANGAGTANINPFANLALSMASGGLDPATIYSSPSTGIIQTITGKLPAAVIEIQTKLQPLLALYDAEKSNPLTDIFIANHKGLDEVLDMVSVDTSAGILTVKDRASSTNIVTGQPNASDKWTIDPTKIPTPQIRAVISPVFVKVPVGKGTVNFTAEVLRSANKKVTWSVVEPGGGTITDTGVYTAPAIEGTYQVKVVSAANPNLPAIAMVKVVPENVTVSINPTSASVLAGGTTSFSVAVSGTSNSKVTWSVVENGGGAITSAGVYTAPATAGIYHVKAVSIADAAKSATATVTVTSSGGGGNPGGLFPLGTWIGPGGFEITIGNLVQSIGSQKYYSGSIKYSSFINGVINVSGNLVDTGSMSSATIIVNNDVVTIGGIDGGSSGGSIYATSFEAHLTKSPINGNKMEGLLVVVSNKIGSSISNSNAVFSRQ